MFVASFDPVNCEASRILKSLARLGAVQVMLDALAADDAWAARDPVMAQLAAAAVVGLPLAGLAERKRAPVAILDGGRPEILGDLVKRAIAVEVTTEASAPRCRQFDRSTLPPASVGDFRAGPALALLRCKQKEHS